MRDKLSSIDFSTFRKLKLSELILPLLSLSRATKFLIHPQCPRAKNWEWIDMMNSECHKST